MCLRMSSPATSRVGNGGWPGPIRQTELKRFDEKLPINLCRQTHQRMAKVDDLIKRWAQTDRPDDRRAAGSRLPSNSKSSCPEEKITNRLNPKSQSARKPRPAPGFLAKSNACPDQIIHFHQSTTSEYFTDDEMSHSAFANFWGLCIPPWFWVHGSPSRVNAVDLHRFHRGN